MKKIILSIWFVFALVQTKAQVSASFGDTLGIWKTINFDTTYQYVQLSPSLQDLWQVGAPQKTFFNSSYSPHKAIVTDTVGMYPPNNHSWFDLYIGNFNYGWSFPMSVFVDFKHKFDTDTLHDGCYITASWDDGITWRNIIDDSIFTWGAHPGSNWIFPDLNLYSHQDTLYNGENGFSGKSNGWVHTSFSWYVIPVLKAFPPDTMILRFNFISDNFGNAKEGWMIDDIRLFSIDMGSDINELQQSNSIFSLNPNPFADKAEIKFNATQNSISLELFDTQGKRLFLGAYSNCDRIDFPLDNLPEGVYLMKATVDNSRVGTQRIIRKM